MEREGEETNWRSSQMKKKGEYGGKVNKSNRATCAEKKALREMQGFNNKKKKKDKDVRERERERVQNKWE